MWCSSARTHTHTQKLPKSVRLRTFTVVTGRGASIIPSSPILSGFSLLTLSAFNINSLAESNLHQSRFSVCVRVCVFQGRQRRVGEWTLNRTKWSDLSAALQFFCFGATTGFFFIRPQTSRTRCGDTEELPLQLCVCVCVYLCLSVDPSINIPGLSLPESSRRLIWVRFLCVYLGTREDDGLYTASRFSCWFY